MPDDKPDDIAAELAYMAARPALFTKDEMAAIMAEAADTIVALRMIASIELEDIETETEGAA